LLKAYKQEIRFKKNFLKFVKDYYVDPIGFKYKYTLEEGLQKLIDWRIATGVDSKK